MPCLEDAFHSTLLHLLALKSVSVSTAVFPESWCGGEEEEVEEEFDINFLFRTEHSVSIPST